MASSPPVLFARLLGRARLRHLQLLVAVADHGTVKQAAGQIGMSQPAATQAIVELERLLEVTLFERQARGMRLSVAGEAVLPVVRQVLQSLQASMEALAAVEAGATGLLRIGAVPAAALSLVSHCLQPFRQRHPRLEIRLVEGTPQHLFAELAGGGLNVVLARRPPELGARFRFEPLLEDEPIVIAGKKHPLAGRARVSLDELAGYPWMRAPEGVGVGELFGQLFDGSGARPVVVPVSTTSPTMVVTLLGDNETLTLAPASVADWYVRRGLVARLSLRLSLALPALGATYPTDWQGQPGLADLLESLRAVGSRD